MATSPKDREPLLAHSDNNFAMAGEEEINSSVDKSMRHLPVKPSTITCTSQQALADPSKRVDIRENVEQYARLFGADEDAFDQPTTTRKELWSYYLYYNGDNGVGPGSYSQTLYVMPSS